MKKAVSLLLAGILSVGLLAGCGSSGFGDIVVRYGLNRYETVIMIVTVVLLVVIVHIMQYVEDKVAQKKDKRK